MTPSACGFPTIQERPESIESWHSWFIAAVALVMSSLSFGAISSVPVLLKPLALEWGTGAGLISLVHTCAMVGAALGGIALGRLQDQHGFFAIGLAASIATGGGLVLTARSDTLLPVYPVFGLLVGAVGQGGLFSALTAAVAQWFDRSRALAIAIVAAGQSVGGLLMPPVLRWGASVSDWRQTLDLYGWFCLVVLTACAMAFRRRPLTLAAARTSKREQLHARLEGGRFIQLGLCMSLLNFATFVAVGHLTAFGEEQGFAPASAAALVSAMLGIALVSRLTIGRLCRRVGSYLAILFMAAVQLAGVATLVVIEGYIGLALAAGLIGIGFGGYLPAFAVFVRERSEDRQAGRRISEIYFFGFSAGGVGSLAGGALRDLAGGYAIPFAVAGCSSACAVALLIWLRRKVDAR